MLPSVVIAYSYHTRYPYQVGGKGWPESNHKNVLPSSGRIGTNILRATQWHLLNFTTRRCDMNSQTHRLLFGGRVPLENISFEHSGAYMLSVSLLKNCRRILRYRQFKMQGPIDFNPYHRWLTSNGLFADFIKQSFDIKIKRYDINIILIVKATFLLKRKWSPALDTVASWLRSLR